MGQLKQWRDQQWVRIGLMERLKESCGTSKDKKTLTVASKRKAYYRKLKELQQHVKRKEQEHAEKRLSQILESKGRS